MPAIWFWSGTTRLHIWNSVNGKLVSYNGDSELPINQYTNIRMMQTQNASGQYIFEISVGGKEVYQIENKTPRDWSDVDVYLSDPWHPAAKVYIKNFVYRNLADGKLMKYTVIEGWSM